MILVNTFVSLAVICSAVYGSPVYSTSVYVKSGSDVRPVGYVAYTPTFSIPRAQLARLTAAPAGSVVGYPSPIAYQGLPCVAPCVYDVAPVAQLPATNAKIITYDSLPKVALGYVPKDDNQGYEYSYMVYDEGTGDQKAQSEKSNGNVVRGQYSLLQPDGYVREVQYSADKDGFNAVVKNIPSKPESVADKAEIKEEKKETEPCKKEEKVEVSSEKPEESKKEDTQELVEVTSEIAVVDVKLPEEKKIYLTFQDLVRCAQAAVSKNEQKPSENAEVNVEPLNKKDPTTYIVIPAINGPC